MPYISSLLLGYVIGNINPAYIISKLAGVDIRTKGSGNAGATNMLLIFGKYAFVFTALFDIMKAFFSVNIANFLFPETMAAGIFAGVGCVFGHIFPIMLGFRGGKGLATLGGLILSYDARLFFIMLAAEIVLALIIDYIVVVPISASLAFTTYYFTKTRILIGTLALLGMSAVIFAKHIENLVRIREGKELRFSYLWNKAEESERMRESYGDEEVDRRQR